MTFLSLSLPAPYLATSQLSLHSIGCKHIPFYFAFPIDSVVSLQSHYGTENRFIQPREDNWAGDLKVVDLIKKVDSNILGRE